MTSTGSTFAGTVTANPGVAGTKAIKAVGTYAGNGDVKLLEFVRAGDAVAGAIEYNDATTDMEIGTVTNHAFSVKTNNTRRLTFANSGAAAFTGQVKTTSASGFVVDAAVDMSMSYYTNVPSTSWGIFSSNNHGETIIGTNLRVDGLSLIHI